MDASALGCSSLRKFIMFFLSTGMIIVLLKPMRSSDCRSKRLKTSSNTPASWSPSHAVWVEHYPWIYPLQRMLLRQPQRPRSQGRQGLWGIMQVLCCSPSNHYKYFLSAGMFPEVYRKLILNSWSLQSSFPTVDDHANVPKMTKFQFRFCCNSAVSYQLSHKGELLVKVLTKSCNNLYAWLPCLQEMTLHRFSQLL